jgi:hypothetical protein
MDIFMTASPRNERKFNGYKPVNIEHLHDCAIQTYSSSGSRSCVVKTCSAKPICAPEDGQLGQMCVCMCNKEKGRQLHVEGMCTVQALSVLF